MRLKDLAMLRVMHAKIAPNTFSMDHYCKVFHFLTLGNCTIKELCRFTELNESSIEHLLSNLQTHQIIHRHENTIRLNDSVEWLLQYAKSQQ